MAKDGTARGGARAGSGRKPKSLTEKIESGNPGGRKLTVMELPPDADLSGEDMPEPKSYMKEHQKSGDDFDAEDVFRETWLWLKERGCEKLVSTQLVRNYAMSVSRRIHVRLEPEVQRNFRVWFPRKAPHHGTGDRQPICEHESELHETGEQPLVSDFSDRQGKLLVRIYGRNSAG